MYSLIFTDVMTGESALDPERLKKDTFEQRSILK